jgi:hypothetical protein
MAISPLQAVALVSQQGVGASVTALNGTTLDSAALRAFVNCDWAELALRRHGWTGERLQKTARRITNDYLKLNVPYLSETKREDMVDFVTEKALWATLRFRPSYPTASYGQNGGNHYDSWICDIMSNRCPDFFRSKHEGFGDKRYNNHDRIVLDADPDPADHDTDFSDLIDERRRARWQQAADQVGWALEEWIAITLDRASKEVLRSAA